MRKKRYILGVSLIVLTMGLAGCGQPSKSSVENSDYYKELQKENENLSRQLKDEKKQTNSLEKKIDKIHETTGDQKLAKLKSNVKDSNIVKVDFASKAVKDQSFAVTNASVCDYAKDIVSGCYRMIGVNPSKLEENYDEVYSYVLIDEDNTAYEFKVYGDSYIIFDDIPANVYAYNHASLIGRALIDAKVQKKYTSFVERVADAQIVVNDKKLKDNETAIRISKILEKIADNVVEKPSYDMDESKWEEYRFYTFGTVTVMRYSKEQKAVCIENKKGDQTYYEISTKNLNKIEKYLK